MKIFVPLISAALFLAGCGPSPTPQAVAPPPPPVEVATAETRTVPVEMKTIGTVEPIASVQLKSKVQGEILAVQFADGAQVKAGDLLFSMDPRPFAAALQRAEANYQIAQTTANNASEQAARYTTLIKRGVASKEQTAQFLTTAESLKSELAARQADVDEAKLSVEWTEVRSPITGRAGAALLKAGNIAQPNVDTLAVINQMQPIYVSFALPESSLAEVRKWMTAGEPTVKAMAPDSGQLLDTGKLNFINNTVDSASGMITFKATFPNADESLWPGQFVDITVQLAEEPNVVVVPSVAIAEGQKGSQVFVVEGDTATLRKVTLSRMVGDSTIVKEGLEPGEQVITSGQLRVTPGGKVRIREQAAAPEEPK